MFHSTDEVFAFMPKLFDPSAAANLEAVFQFQVSDRGSWQIRISDGQCDIKAGEVEAPTVRMTADEETWLRICNGQLNGIHAALIGKLKVKGNILLADRLMKIFPFGCTSAGMGRRG